MPKHLQITVQPLFFDMQRTVPTIALPLRKSPPLTKHKQKKSNFLPATIYWFNIPPFLCSPLPFSQTHRPMAPQNSTLIHGNAAATGPASTISAAADEELSSYSPILAARTSHRRRPAPPPTPCSSTGAATAGGKSIAGGSSGGHHTIRGGTGKGAVKRETAAVSSKSLSSQVKPWAHPPPYGRNFEAKFFLSAVGTRILSKLTIARFF